MTLEILALGGAEEVGRSSFLLEENDHRILLDAGLKLFPKRLNIPPLEPAIPKEMRKQFFSSLDSILVSHAHLDHIGYIPAAFHYGYNGKVIMTKPTSDLAKLTWADGLKIQGERFFTEEDIKLTEKNILSIDYRQKIRISDSVNAKFHDAGHILGSAAIELDWDGQRILYTGDINDEPSLLHTGHKIPQTGEKYSTIISEATNHHNAIHIPKTIAMRDLTSAILDVYKRKGKVIIPSFALGRSQEIISILMTYLDDLLYSFPIYIAGAINKVNMVYDKYFNPDWINPSVIEQIKEQNNSFCTPWDHEGIQEIKGFTDQKQIMKENKPKIIIATHGMVETGPVHNFLALGGHQRINLMTFVGYQAPGSIGADILSGIREIELGYGKHKAKYKLNLQIEKFGFSGHISRDHLQRFLESAQKGQVLTVHGDNDSMINLRNGLVTNGINASVLPSLEPFVV